VASGLRPPPDSALIVPTRDGDEWKRHDWQNWRRRIYQPAASAAGVTGDLRPCRLRGSFVSLLLWEGRSLAYVSKQAGHSIATLAKHYAGVIEELEDQPRIPASGSEDRRATRPADQTRTEAPGLALWSVPGNPDRGLAAPAHGAHTSRLAVEAWAALLLRSTKTGRLKTGLMAVTSFRSGCPVGRRQRL
jgi:hypothetical protein